MNFLVTGGAGFIGSHLVDSLLHDGHNVTAIDNLSTGDKKNLEASINNPNLEFIKGDILELPELDYLISHSDMVFHLAAAVGVELVVKDPAKTTITNVHGTERVLEAAVKNKTKILLASTSEVYGKSEKESFSEEDDLLIGPPTHSRWSYASSKLLDEFYCMAFHKEYGLPITIARFFNTVGPRQTGKYGMVIPRFVNKAINNLPLEVYGTGEQVRCFSHVYDTIRALRSLADNNPSGEIYNIGTKNSININELAEKIVELTGSGSKIVHKSYDEAYEPGFEDMMKRVPNISKIQKHIGWEPYFSLDRIILDVYDFIKNELHQ